MTTFREISESLEDAIFMHSLTSSPASKVPLKLMSDPNFCLKLMLKSIGDISLLLGCRVCGTPFASKSLVDSQVCDTLCPEAARAVGVLTLALIAMTNAISIHAGREAMRLLEILMKSGDLGSVLSVDEINRARTNRSYQFVGPSAQLYQGSAVSGSSTRAGMEEWGDCRSVSTNLRQEMAQHSSFKNAGQAYADTQSCLQPTSDEFTVDKTEKIITPKGEAANDIGETVTRTLLAESALLPGHEPEQEATKYSPSHFQYGLFSPRTTAVKVDVEYPRLPRVLLQHRNSETFKQVSDSELTTSFRYMPPAQLEDTIGRNLSELNNSLREPASLREIFWSKVAKLQDGRISRARADDSRLIFAIPNENATTSETPNAQNHTELCVNGSCMSVNAQNVDQFLHLVKQSVGSNAFGQYIKEWSTPKTETSLDKNETAAHALPDEPTSSDEKRNKISNRLIPVTNDSLNTLVDEGKFSPRHFEHGLFAPYSGYLPAIPVKNKEILPEVYRS